MKVDHLKISCEEVLDLCDCKRDLKDEKMALMMSFMIKELIAESITARKNWRVEKCIGFHASLCKNNSKKM